MQHGDFTALAENYAKYRPGYSPYILDALLGLYSVSPHGNCKARTLVQGPVSGLVKWRNGVCV